MSVLLNCGPRSQPATKLQIMIEQKSREQEGKVGDRVAEGAPRQRVAVGEVDAQRVAEEYAAERERGDEIQRAAHAHHIRQEADGEQNERIEQHLQSRV